MIKQKIEESGKWEKLKKDERLQLLWCISRNEIPFVVYLFEKENPVDPRELGWKAINDLIKNDQVLFFSNYFEGKVNQDMKEILYYYERKHNMTEDRIRYFVEKYGVR